MLAPGDMFILPSNLNWKVLRSRSLAPSEDRRPHMCTIIACEETHFGTRGRTYTATLLVDDRIVSGCELQETALDGARFIHRSG